MFPLQVGYFHLAKNVSKLSNHDTKVGCVIAKKKPLIACANKVISHPKYSNGSTYSKSLHAEIRALLNCETDDLNDAIAYVYRETKNGDPAIARPCDICMEALRDRGIKKVFYTVDEYPYYNWERI